VKNLFILFLISVSGALFAQDTTTVDPYSFEALLDSCNMEFTAPLGYKEVSVIENMQMNYEKAYKHPTKNFEVRYALRRTKLNLPESMIMVTVLNISGGQIPEYNMFGTDAVKKEFNADSGGAASCTLGPEFGQDYKYCLLVYIHKNNVGDGYIFYLSNDNEIIPDLMEPLFHNLKFRE
jgi:hypothetical protein